MWKLKAFTAGVGDKERTTLCFAVSELKKYLSMSTEEPVIMGETEEKESGAILLGIGLSDELPSVKDLRLNDAVLIDVKGRSGIITGVNARSVLIAVYRYLTELGFSFVRPGRNGEKAPDVLVAKDVSVCEKPSYGHRMACIEGSTDYESVEALIDWLPKVGMNGYYMQFFTPLIFFKRWYAHKGYEFANPYLKGDELSVDDVNAMVSMLEREVEKRDLVYIKVGHGWTCEPFGMTSYGWEPVDPNSIPEGVEKYLALVDGKREIPKEGRYAYVPMVSQLCYGCPEVRERMVEFIVDYCKKNPHIDIIAFSFGDGGNTHCECELCRDTRPADFLVLIVNEAVRRLKQEGLQTKISFSMYADNFWPPVKYEVEDQDRVLFSFAPSSRSYSHPFVTKSDAKIRPFVRNKLTYPTNMNEIMAYYREWRKIARCPTRVFDYYYMWDCYMDLGATDRTRVIMKDIQNYRELDIDGLISCQGQRVFCPTSLGMNVMARTLWNRDVDFDDVRDEVLEDEYGKDFALVRDYLQDLSTYSLPEVTRQEKPFCAENIPIYEKGIARIKEFDGVIEAHLGHGVPCEAVSWKNLKFHSQLSLMMLELFVEISKGADPLALWEPVEEFLNRNEWEYREYFDVFEFKYTYHRLVFPQINKKRAQGTIGM